MKIWTAKGYVTPRIVLELSPAKDKPMSFDNHCYDLAAVFLSGEPALNTEPKRNELAQLIQTTIEDWIEYGDHKEVGSKKST